MLFPAGKMVLPWALLLFLLGCQLLVSPISYRKEEEVKQKKKQDDDLQYFPPTLEFAVYKFNLLNEDRYAYKVMNLLDAKKLDGEGQMMFAMRVKLGRTKCKKYEEDLDNCPFHDSPLMKKNITCFFIVGSRPWKSAFELLKDDCSS